MRNALVALCLLASSLAAPALAQVSIHFGRPGVHIGINLPVYPTFQRVPGYPVYYAQDVGSNYFFYDGLYWVFEDDNWYSSSWYNGPWYAVDPFDVPLYVLRVPVRYYRHAPVYFRSWRADAPPRWGERFGGSWEQRRSGWDRWDRRSTPAPAPLPTYQRQYSGERYPQVTQQATIQARSYRYEPRDPVAQQHFQQRREQVQREPTPQLQAIPQRRPMPTQQAPQPLPQAQIPQPMSQRQGLPQPMAPSARQGLAPREAPAATPQAQERAGPGNVPGRGPQQEEEKGKGHDRGEERGKGHDRGEERGKGRDRGEERGKGRGKE